jgi:hypothetical protein
MSAPVLLCQFCWSIKRQITRANLPSQAFTFVPSMGKPGQRRQAKFGEKGNKHFFSKNATLRHFVHPKVQKYIQKCLKLIVFQYNSFIQTSKISKNNFFPSFPRLTFQNAIITHKIFEILWCPFHRIFCTWYTLIKHINIGIWKKWLWLGFPIDGHI